MPETELPEQILALLKQGKDSGQIARMLNKPYRRINCIIQNRKLRSKIEDKTVKIESTTHDNGVLVQKISPGYADGGEPDKNFNFNNKNRD